MQLSSLENRVNTHMPPNHRIAHQLCFIVHDVMAQSLVSGMNASVFHRRFKFRDDEDRKAFQEAESPFAWLEQSRRGDEWADLYVSTVFPAVLSDMLHCIYEALETSRKGKLCISYMLIRKPIKESLFLLESIVIDRHDFAKKLATGPMKLFGPAAGGVEAHAKRIRRVLAIVGEADRFDANYLARLRYDKPGKDSFDGPCDKATHLFTDRSAILTELSNINFIFSTEKEKITQWSYLYSRLPYLFIYMHCLVEHVYKSIVVTDAVYIRDMHRRISALVLLWGDSIVPPYDASHLRRFILKTRDRLIEHCLEAGFRVPIQPDLERMADTGAYPGETQEKVDERSHRFVQLAEACGSLPS